MAPREEAAPTALAVLRGAPKEGTPSEQMLSNTLPPIQPKTSNNQLNLISLEPINLEKTTSPTRVCTRQMDYGNKNLRVEL